MLIQSFNFEVLDILYTKIFGCCVPSTCYALVGFSTRGCAAQLSDCYLTRPIPALALRLMKFKASSISFQIFIST